MNQKKYEECSKKTKKIIDSIDSRLSICSPSYVSDRSGVCSVEDVVDAMNYILGIKWFDRKTLYARMILCRSSFLSDRVVFGVRFVTSITDFDWDEYYLPINNFPLIVGKPSDDDTSEEVNVSIFEDSENYTLEQWKNKHHMNLEEGDPVVILSGSNINFENGILTAYYTGEKEIDDETGKIKYGLAPRLDLSPYNPNNKQVKTSKMLCHGVGIDSECESYFLTLPEYNFYFNCFSEATQRASSLLEFRSVRKEEKQKQKVKC